MSFGLAARKHPKMQAGESIEILLLNELNGLCTTCAEADHCLYRKATDKIVIQCQHYEFNLLTIVNEPERGQPGGLCMNCAKADFCRLPDRIIGVWHCEEYM